MDRFQIFVKDLYLVIYLAICSLIFGDIFLVLPKNNLIKSIKTSLLGQYPLNNNMDLIFFAVQLTLPFSNVILQPFKSFHLLLDKILILPYHIFQRQPGHSPRNINKFPLCCDNPVLPLIIVCHFHRNIKFIRHQSIPQSPFQYISSIAVRTLDQIYDKFGLAGGSRYNADILGGLVDQLCDEEGHPSYFLLIEVWGYLLCLGEGINNEVVELRYDGFDNISVGGVDDNHIPQGFEGGLRANDFEFIGCSNLWYYFLLCWYFGYFVVGVHLHLSFELFYWLDYLVHLWHQIFLFIFHLLEFLGVLVFEPFVLLTFLFKKIHFLSADC